MSCEICDENGPNCDCTDGVRLAYELQGELDEAREEVEAGKKKVRKLLKKIIKMRRKKNDEQRRLKNNRHRCGCCRM